MVLFEASSPSANLACHLAVSLGILPGTPSNVATVVPARGVEKMTFCHRRKHAVSECYGALCGHRSRMSNVQHPARAQCVTERRLRYQRRAGCADTAGISISRKC